MSKGNIHKKDYEIDEFARRYYCQHARNNQLREDKRRAKRKTRRKRRETEKQIEEENINFDSEINS